MSHANNKCIYTNIWHHRILSSAMLMGNMAKICTGQLIACIKHSEDDCIPTYQSSGARNNSHKCSRNLSHRKILLTQLENAFIRTGVFIERNTAVIPIAS